MFHELKILICGAFFVLNSSICSATYYSSDYYSGNGIYNKGRWVVSGEGGFIPTFIPPTPPSNNLQCARIFDQPNYQGRSADFNKNHKNLHWDWYNYGFKPQSVTVRSECALTLYDDYGKKKTYRGDSQWVSEWNYPVSSTCCECGGCFEATALKDVQCARLYEHERCNGCDGIRLDLKHGDKVKSFGNLDNLMSSLVVRPGCQLTTFYDENFQGFRINFTSSMNMFGDNWNRQISSAECNCPYDPYPTVTLPTVPPTWQTRPPITLPTQRPTWPIITSPTLPPIYPTWYTRPPITFPTVPTTWGTFPTYRPTWPIITMPTVPTTTERTTIRYTLPTAPTTWSPNPTTSTNKYTLPTSPTTWSPNPTTSTNKYTLPTSPTTWSPNPTTSTNKYTLPTSATTWKPNPTTTVQPTFPPTERFVIMEALPDSPEEKIPDLTSNYTEEDESSEDDSDEGGEREWEFNGSDEQEETTTLQTTTTSTTTTPKPTTRRTTTTTEAPEEDEDDDGFGDDW